MLKTKKNYLILSLVIYVLLTVLGLIGLFFSIYVSKNILFWFFEFSVTINKQWSPLPSIIIIIAIIVTLVINTTAVTHVVVGVWRKKDNTQQQSSQKSFAEILDKELKR